ncbi:MAG: hypothetical protein IPK26_19260 [Planctomycetes bacterium]|nr:hypothetical protein [Planctomycetota bacterium]
MVLLVGTNPNTETMESNNDKSNQPEALGSAEYRARLTTKLNCLIAVLEVAISKISKSMDLPGANEERLLKIRSNLENTLSICHRAKQTLERTGATATRSLTNRSANGDRAKMTARDYVELSSIDEYRKFKRMTPIAKGEVESVDFDELARRLSDM